MSVSNPAGVAVSSQGLLDSPKPFGKYYLIRKLAEGGMAEIFLAKQIGAEGFERNVVIKRMLSNLSSLPDFVGMFLDEARLAARLNHQNIVQINDLGLADDFYYICMEYLPGEDFSTVLRVASSKREYVPLHLCLRIVADAAHGLHFAHEFTDETGRPLNVVHRDISPANVYVTYQGQVKLLDFGIAKAESRITNTTSGVVKGKYIYMAPEQARSGTVDRRADVYALGVSLYESVTNVRPFARENDLAILNAVLKGDFQPPRKLRPDLPVEIEAIILKAMDTHLETRYQNAGQFAADIEKFLLGSTSISGGVHVGNYIRLIAGDARVAWRTRIPTLSSMMKAQSGSISSEVPRFTPNEVHSTKVISTKGAIVARRRSRLIVAGVVTLLVLALTAAGLLGSRFFKREPHPVAAAPLVPPPEELALPSMKQVDPTPKAVSPPTKEAVPIEEAVDTKERLPRLKTKITALTLPDIEKYVARRRSTVLHCFEQYKDQLPGNRGQISIKFSISGTGKVTNASVEGPFATTPVGLCLQQKVQQIKFPRNTDREITVSIPFAYSIH